MEKLGSGLPLGLKACFSKDSLRENDVRGSRRGHGWSSFFTCYQGLACRPGPFGGGLLARHLCCKALKGSLARLRHAELVWRLIRLASVVCGCQELQERGCVRPRCVTHTLKCLFFACQVESGADPALWGRLEDASSA